MKICVYDILDYEEPILEAIKAEGQAQLVEVHKPLSPKTLEAARGCDGVSVLGYSQINRKLLEAMAAMGIRRISTRTIGYDHIDAAALQKMKRGVILINTARGKLIDTESLIQALESGQVGGAGIDTLEEESGVMHVHVGTRVIDNRSLLYLKQFPNVLYTQHYAFFTQEAAESMVRCGIQSILDGIRGIPTPCEVR